MASKYFISKEIDEKHYTLKELTDDGSIFNQKTFDNIKAAKDYAHYNAIRIYINGKIKSGSPAKQLIYKPKHAKETEAHYYVIRVGTVMVNSLTTERYEGKIEKKISLGNGSSIAMFHCPQYEIDNIAKKIGGEAIKVND